MCFQGDDKANVVCCVYYVCIVYGEKKQDGNLGDDQLFVYIHFKVHTIEVE